MKADAQAARERMIHDRKNDRASCDRMEARRPREEALFAEAAFCATGASRLQREFL